MISYTQKTQFEFWSGFSQALELSSFTLRKPAAKSWCYLPIGTSRARIVVTIDLAKDRVGCKLAVRPAATGGPPDQAHLVFAALSRERPTIETELGFTDLKWGKPTGTRIYRFESITLHDPAGWPVAYDWLISCAEQFKQVFGPRIGQMKLPGEDGSTSALKQVEALGPWSSWTPIATSRDSAPRKPGVYMAQIGPDGPVVYVGMAGERSGNGTKPMQGIRGRLNAYLTGQSLGGGLLGRGLDRALRNPEWLRQRLADVESGRPARAKDWGKAALVPYNLHVRWKICASTAGARDLERECLKLLKDTGLWNYQD